MILNCVDFEFLHFVFSFRSLDSAKVFGPESQPVQASSLPSNLDTSRE